MVYGRQKTIVTGAKSTVRMSTWSPHVAACRRVANPNLISIVGFLGGCVDAENHVVHLRGLSDHRRWTSQETQEVPKPKRDVYMENHGKTMGKPWENNGKTMIYMENHHF